MCSELKSSSWPKENLTVPEKAGLDYPLDHTRSEPMTFKIYNRKKFHIFTCLHKCLHCKEQGREVGWGGAASPPPFWKRYPILLPPGSGRSLVLSTFPSKFLAMIWPDPLFALLEQPHLQKAKSSYLKIQIPLYKEKWNFKDVHFYGRQTICRALSHFSHLYTPVRSAQLPPAALQHGFDWGWFSSGTLSRKEAVIIYLLFLN